jgi:CRP-like cAMP-binding protein
MYSREVRGCPQEGSFPSGGWGRRGMAEPGQQANLFMTKIRDLFRKETLYCRALKIRKYDHVYTCGEQDSNIYLVESGQVKLTLLSPEFRECIVAIHVDGDIFGEACLYGRTTRSDTAVAMQTTAVRTITSQRFLMLLKRESLLEDLVQYLAARVAEQQEVITSLLTVNCEQRLAMNLLQLGRRLGRQSTGHICIEQKLSQEELAEMVGTTRTRIGIFLKRFQELGLIGLNERRWITIEENKLSDYISCAAQ